MPSELTGAVREALSGSRDAFRSAVADAVEQVRSFLAENQGAEVRPAERAASELGSFAVGRIDPARFASLFERGEGLDDALRARVERALESLRRALEAGDSLFEVEVGSAADLRDEVGQALARAGRVFGAAQTVELIRTGRYDAARHDSLLDAFPVRRWNRAERQIAPPLIVTVDGSALRAEGLAEYLDGSQKIVLVVRGQAPPAPLVRLITPGVLVAQTDSVEAVEALADRAGPAVVALVPEGTARFLHDPAAGRSLRDRLTIEHLPQEAPRGALGELTAFRMSQELGQLSALAAVATTGPAVVAATPAGGAAPASPATTAQEVAQTEPADMLAAWLLRQADISDIG